MSAGVEAQQLAVMRTFGAGGGDAFTPVQLQALLAQIDESSPGHVRASVARLVEEYGRAQRALEAAIAQQSDARHASERHVLVQAAVLTPVLRRWAPRRLLLRCLVEVVLLVLVAPVSIFLLLLPLGSLLAWIEGWDWRTGCLYIVSIVCGLAQPIGAAGDVDPLTTMAKTACSIAGLWSLGLTGAIATVAGTYSESARLLKAVCRWLVTQCCCRPANVAEHSSFLPFLACALVLSPILILAVVFVFALWLMWIDYGASSGAGTTVDSPMFYYLADVGGLPNPLVAWIPTSQSASTFADIYFSLVLYVFSSACLGASQELLPGDMPAVLRRRGSQLKMLAGRFARPTA